MSLNEIKKELHFPGKGHHETFEIVNPLKETRTAKNVIRNHVPENGDT
jgi:hypothetical protein